MRKVILLYCSSVIFLFGCSVLSDSQLKNINTFAKAAKNYSAFPGETVRQCQQLHYNNDVLEASAIPDSNQVIRSLDGAKAEFKKGVAFSKKMDVSLQLIQKYAALLAQLSSDSFADDLGKSSKDLSHDLNDAVGVFNAEFSDKIPANVGNEISKIITIIGDRIIRNKQSKALKRFIPAGDTLIQLTVQGLVSALDADLKPLIQTYKATFQIDYNTIIFNHPDKIDYNMLQFYVKTNSDYADVELLRKRCIHAAEKMASAHKELRDNITRKKNLKELLSETKDFVSDVKGLYEVIGKLSMNS